MGKVTRLNTDLNKRVKRAGLVADVRCAAQHLTECAFAPNHELRDRIVAVRDALLASLAANDPTQSPSEEPK